MSRIDKDSYFLELAFMTSLRGTCRRRNVGCILVNERGHIIGTGYNGNAAGLTHCIDTPCQGANCKSGTGLDLCEAIHAEINALIQCRNNFDIHSVYCTDSPCIHCVKALLNTSAKRLVFSRLYPHSESQRLWMSDSSRSWIHHEIEKPLAFYYI